MKSLLIVFLLVECQRGFTSSYFPDQLQLTVYYESKCPDSRRFVVEQLQPAVNRLQDYLRLTLIPFGKAASMENGSGGFQCQHGPPECLGNLVQDCALYHMQNRLDVEKVEYVACEMQTLAGTQGNLMCVQNSNLPVDLIQKCISSNEGIELQLISEHATNRIRPKFIPTVTINNEFNQQIQDHAQVDLLGTLCSLMKDAPPCATHYNRQALGHVLM